MRLKTTYLLILSLFFASTHLFSQETTGKTGALLWKISGNGLNKPSYILGTYHLMPAAFLDSISGCREALNNSEQVVGELDLSNFSAMQVKVQQAGMMPSDTTYQQLFSTDDLAFLDKKFIELFHNGVQQLGVLKPAMINTLYVVTLLQKYYPSLRSQQSMDEAVQKQEKPVVGLETVENQVYVLFGSQSLQRQAELLICALRNEDNTVEILKKMHQYYRNADLNALYRLQEDKTNDPCPASTEEDNNLNKNRNDRWIQKLPALMKEKSSFVAVGCLHLAGPAGLLAQLEKLGYTVEAVN